MPIKTTFGYLGLNSPVNLNIFCDKIVNTLSSDLSRASSYDNYIASMHERVILKSLAFIFYLMVIVQESENSSANRTVLARFPRTHWSCPLHASLIPGEGFFRAKNKPVPPRILTPDRKAAPFWRSRTSPFTFFDFNFLSFLSIISTSVLASVPAAVSVSIFTWNSYRIIPYLRSDLSKPVLSSNFAFGELKGRMTFQHCQRPQLRSKTHISLSIGVHSLDHAI